MNITWLKYYGIPLLLLIVAIAQLCMVEAGLNRWKGGGFGMYSSFHHTNTVVQIKSGKTTSIQTDSMLIEEAIPQELMEAVEIFPSEKNIKQLALVVSNTLNHDSLSIEIWKPSLRLDSLSYRRKLIIRYNQIDGSFKKQLE